MTKEARIYNREKHSLFNKCCWKNCTATCKRMKLEHSLTPYTKINSKGSRDLNVWLDTIELLEENIGRTTFDINNRKIFFDPCTRVMEIKTKISKWDLMKLKSFCKWNYKQDEKTTLRMGENICKQINGQRINLQNIYTAHAAQY